MDSTENAPFVHLHAHSAYSLAEGAIPVKQLVKLCKQNNMPAAAITDTGNLFGAMEFSLEAVKNGVQPILGCELALTEERYEIVLIVQNEQGYRNLCAIISKAYMEGDPAHDPYTSWETLSEYHEGLICLTGGVNGVLYRPLFHHQDEQAETFLERLNRIFGNRLYVEIQRHGWPEQDRAEGRLIDLAYKCDVPLVATNNAYFPKQAMAEAHDALLCIADGRYITEEDRRRVTAQHYFKSASEMSELFQDLPEAIQNASVIAQRCHFLLKPIDPLLPPFETGEGRDEVEELKAQAHAGLKWRLENFVIGGDQDEKIKTYTDRLNYELDVIIKMGFPGYFLICSDFIKWSKEQNIPVGPGRGSGAGSLVAWALQITDLDPLPFNLLFERFLNPERVSMPDFDVDFCQDRRDEVIRYVQDKYGHDKVAQIITFGKLQARAVVRDVGRVLQMPYGQVDRIAKLIPNNPANPMTLGEALAQDADLRAERERDDTGRKLIDIALKLEGLYRHASTHAAGVVIGDRPLQELLPLYRDPRSDMPVTQFNMKYVEQAGLVKFDFLGLKTMTVIQKAVELVADKGIDVDYLQIPFNDDNTFKLLTDGKTTGVFQLESAGMRDTLRKLKPDRFEDIIALVALYRPGPMDNIPLYIECKEGRSEPDYHHPKLRPYLEETYGIMIYQEQVMQAAQELAGYTLGGADLLRRAMGKKIKEAMDAERVKFVAGAKEHSGIDEKRANEIFDLLAKFAGYGFNKSHAAAYALIAYWTAWLKANHPVEFMAASMTLDLHNTDKLSVFRQDLLEQGIELLPPDVNASSAEFSVEDGKIRYALAALKGVGEQAMRLLVEERAQNGPYKSIEDLTSRLDTKVLNKRQLERLVHAGAFDSLEPNRARVFNGIERMIAHAHALADERESGQSSLFGGESGVSAGALELPDSQPWDPLEKLQYEFEAVGFYLSAHPLDTKAEQLKRLNIYTMADVAEELANKNAAAVKMAGVLIKKQEKVSAKSGKKYAFLHVSDPSGVFEVTAFSETLAAARDYLETGQTLLLNVSAEQREDQIRFTAQSIERLDGRLERTLEEVRVHVSEKDCLPQLQTLLQTEGRGSLRMTIMVDAPDGECVLIRIPGKWNFSSAARQAIRHARGVIEVAEL